jgi:hypothetical protein
MGSEEGSFGVSFMERLFGFIVLVSAIILTYYTVTSSAALGIYTSFFTFLCIIVLIVGIVLLTARIE